MSGSAGGDQHREMAEKHTILRVPVGSVVHGLNVPGTDDRDEMGICIEDLRPAFGLGRPFEQYVYRSAAEREGKHDAPSQAGDLDLTIYSLRKWLRLALEGNPTVITALFVPHRQWVAGDSRGSQLQELAPFIVSKHAGRRYLGYLESQRQRLLGERGQKKVNRPELEEKYGYDTKYAMHMVRLGYQGVELLETGRLTLPLAEPTRRFVYSIRQGEVDLQEVLTITGELERKIEDLITDGPIREEPDREHVESWMLRLYLENWKARDPLGKANFG